MRFLVAVLLAIVPLSANEVRRGGPLGPPAAQTPQPAPQQTFDDFLAGLRVEAAAKGISQATIDAALTGIEPLPVAVERDRTQPETVVSLDEYVARRVTPKVIKNAKAVATQYADVLTRVEADYGVPPNVLIAVWGVESNFGAFTGTRPTIAALATLAYDGRRALFRNELFDALKIVDAGHIAVDQLKGSWAGAMGQPQFMPSSYLRYAVDFDKDGKADIWTTQADVFGSIGNYLKEYGWKPTGRWGREVKLTKAARAKIDHTVAMRTGNCKATREMTVARPLKEWARLGVTLPGGARLPKADIDASLVRGDKRFFLVYANFDALLGYNCANSYAVTIGLLSDQIK
jgi:membrane-bound lytic murein transglycosylase B